MGVSVVIVHWNRPVECSRTVHCFAGKSGISEITVVDNGSEAARVQELTSLLPTNANLVFLPENRGWGGAINVALKDWLQNGTSRYLCVSAHDALPQDGCLEILVEAMDSDPSLGIVCPEYGEPHIPRTFGGAYCRYLRMAETVEKVDYVTAYGARREV
jgi:GT2 family glycosyltransferase